MQQTWIAMFGVKCEVVYGGVSGTAEVPQWICFDQERCRRSCAWSFQRTGSRIWRWELMMGTQCPELCDSQRFPVSPRALDLWVWRTTNNLPDTEKPFCHIVHLLLIFHHFAASPFSVIGGKQIFMAKRNSAVVNLWRYVEKRCSVGGFLSLSEMRMVLICAKVFWWVIFSIDISKDKKKQSLVKIAYY